MLVSKGTIVVLAVLLACPMLAPAQPADLIIRNGRVIDPESGLDEVRTVVVSGGQIIDVTSTDVAAERIAESTTVIDASGLVVAPGFIDLHVHGHSDQAREYQVRDGVTTALELEWGYGEIASFLASRRGRSRVHYGASASHGMLRALAMAGSASERDTLRRDLAAAVAVDESLRAAQGVVGHTFYTPLADEQELALHDEFERALAEGALGIGMPHAYYPGATSAEIFRVFEMAADLAVPIYTHVRGRELPAVQEVVANAVATGASLHVVHVNSVSLGDIDPVLRMIQGVRARGFDVTTEVYPYTAGSTSIQAAVFDGDWQASYGVSYDGLQWQETGERLNAETFARYRREGGVVIIHMMQEEWIEKALANDWVLVASDGMPYAPGAHPRTAGTFARVLGHYVRDRELLSLPVAISKMTLLPARRLENLAPQMRRKGRVQRGADADLVIFDPARVQDTATFEGGLDFSRGIEHVLVGGVAVVSGGQAVPDVFPGEAIVGEWSGR